jgi:two-component system, response regulator RegA
MSASRGEILLVDDDHPFLERLARAFEKRGFTVRAAGSALAVREGLAAGWKPGAAVIDLKMPGESGLDLVRWLGEFHPKVRVLVLTGYGSIATAVHAMRIGASDYLTKPADADQIERALFGAAAPSTAEMPPPSLGRVEWEHLHRVLQECGGSISAAARALGIERRSLQRKLQKYPPPR